MKPRSWFSGDPKKEKPAPDFVEYEQLEKAVGTEFYDSKTFDEDAWVEAVPVGLGVPKDFMYPVSSVSAVLDVQAKQQNKQQKLTKELVDLAVYCSIMKVPMTDQLVQEYFKHIGEKPPLKSFEYPKGYGPSQASIESIKDFQKEFLGKAPYPDSLYSTKKASMSPSIAEKKLAQEILGTPYPYVQVPKKDIILGNKVDMLVWDEIADDTPLYSDKPLHSPLGKSALDETLEWANGLENGLVEKPKVTTGFSYVESSTVSKPADWNMDSLSNPYKPIVLPWGPSYGFFTPTGNPWNDLEIILRSLGF